MSATLQINTARAFLPMLRPSRYKGLHGGRGGAKSHFFAELLVERCMMHPGTRAVCIREIQKSLEQSVKRLIEDKIKAHGVGRLFRVLDTHIETPGDGIIIFNGMQNHTADSIKSLQGYHVAWVEEAQSLSAKSLQILRPTIRENDGEIWFSWNPRDPEDPVDDMLRGNGSRIKGTEWEPPPDTIILQVNYFDNPWFPDVLKNEMLWDKRVDYETYEHVWEGAYEKHSQARVFKNWREEEFETPPGTSFYLGADWGFTEDPSTLVRCFTQEKNPATGVPWPRKRLYIDYDTLGVGVEIDHLPALFDGLLCGCHPQIPQLACKNPTLHGWARQWPIIADSAQPQTISYMRRNGYGRMEAAKKGPNSVKEGVIFLQGYDIFIHPRAKHALKEFKAYSYKKDPLTGKVIPLLEDKENHIIDPTRYAVEQLRGLLRVHQAVWG